MSIVFLGSLCKCQITLASRALSCTPVVTTKQWRMDQGLPVNRTAEGVLVDGPDFTYLDGRPTPLLHKQKARMLKQQGFAAQIVELNSELQFAKDRHQRMQEESVRERQKIISNRLKPKGMALKKKSH